MKVEIEIVADYSLEGAVIRTTSLTDEVENARSILEDSQNGFVVYKDNSRYVCQLDKIYYVEAVDNKIFVYTKNNCYEAKHKLYELEKILDDRFFRCSKSMICNSRKIKSVSSDYNSRMRAVLLNDEEIVINRSYIKELKKRLGV